MLELYEKIGDLWPVKCRKLLKDKGLSVRRLKKKFSYIFFPWDAGYNEYRFFAKLQIQELPLFVVSATSIEDIMTFLTLANDKKLSLRIIAGRHSSNVQNPDVYLDMSKFDHISMKKNILTLEGGVNQGSTYLHVKNNGPKYGHIVSTRHTNSLANSLSSYLSNIHPTSFNVTSDVASAGYASNCGNQPSVCISGFTSCGGISNLKRTFGLTSDSLISARIVVPPANKDTNAELIQVDKNHHPDLFWALRGGLCSNFGVVTEMVYKLPKVDQVILYSVTYPFNLAPKVLTYWLDTAPNRSDQFNEDINLSVKGNENTCEFGGMYVVPRNSNIKEAKEIIKQELKGIIAIGGTLKYKAASYFDAVEYLVSQRNYYPFSATRIFMSSNKIDVNYIINQLEAARNLKGIFMFSVDLLGGKIAKLPDTAYFPRKAEYFYELFCFCESTLDLEDLSAWTNNVFEHIYNVDTDNVFLGFIIPNLKDHLKKYYGENRYKLLEIKKKYDPLGILNMNQGINV